MKDTGVPQFLVSSFVRSACDGYNLVASSSTVVPTPTPTSSTPSPCPQYQELILKGLSRDSWPISALKVLPCVVNAVIVAGVPVLEPASRALEAPAAHPSAATLAAAATQAAILLA
ncbi:hypothetical protein Nepgr_005407 [Nepenthes gracilis]|uniref:Uncharacterized protein n=1 Tax=Nepenthes gracilis TaxID=150966 RepID=A0AAD3XGE9_NEPGR|nr:hypothetical protein Nepgr_005407 [Nepenthes gracilis]